MSVADNLQFNSNENMVTAMVIWRLRNEMSKDDHGFNVVAFTVSNSQVDNHLNLSLWFPMK